MNETTVGIVALVVLLALFSTGIELGFAMALVGFAGFAYFNGIQAAMNLIGRDIYDVITNYGYTVFPLFILMGQIGFNAGIAVRLYSAANKFVGHIPGGLAMATVMGATGFKAICGSSAATSATFASVAIPEMDRYGYDRRLSTGIVATVGTLGCIIPPSVVLIIFGILTEQSIGQLFLAGMIPGLHYRLLLPRHHLRMGKDQSEGRPQVGPVHMGAEGALPARGRLDTPRLSAWWWAASWRAYFTPTEAGAVGTFAVFRPRRSEAGHGVQRYVQSLSEAIRTAGMILMLIAGSTILGHFIAVTNIPQHVADWVVALPLNRYIIMITDLLRLRAGGLFHRRPRLHDPCHPHLLPGGAQAGLQSALVRHRDRRGRDDRRGHPPCGRLRLRGKEHHQGADGQDIQRGGTLSALARGGVGAPVRLSPARALAPLGVL